MNGEMAAMSSSPSRELALEKSEWLRMGRGSPEVGTAGERGVPHCKLTQAQSLYPDPLTSIRKEGVPPGGEGTCV